jgi:hypothetical protein
MIILRRNEQSLKHSYLISVISAWRVTAWNDEHPEKQRNWSEVTRWGNVNEMSDSQLEKQRSLI